MVEKKKKKRKEERIGRDGGRNERGEGEGGGGEETEKREGRKNSVPVQKPTKREGGRGGEKRGGEGRDWNILKDAFRLNAADEIVSCQGRREGGREGEANGARKRSKMKIRERNSSLRKRNLFEEEVISEVTS